MDNRPVLFIDSGIGGIPYCREFVRRNGGESVYYLADRLNFPYGQKEKEELTAILTALTEKLLKAADPKIIVLACNSAAVSALASLRQNFPHALFVGTVPAIKPAMEACKSGKTGLLGTARTIEAFCNRNIIDGRCVITGIAAPELVEFVERRFEEADENEKTAIVKKYIALFHDAGADTLVLGCTHFLYLLEEFRQEAGTFIKIFDSLEGIVKRLESLLNENAGALRADNSTAAKRRFLLTGPQEPDSSWKKRAEVLEADLCLLNDL